MRWARISRRAFLMCTDSSHNGRDTNEDGHDLLVLERLTDRIIDARENFFEFVRAFDDSVHWETGEVLRFEGKEPPNRYDSLFTFFDFWMLKVSEDMMSRERLWLDPRATEALSRQFERLLPTIYLLICETYDQDPSKLDLIQADPVTGEETRVTRRVTTKLPEFRYTYANETERGERMTTVERERAVVTHLVTGALELWPLPVYGPDDPNGPRRYL
jgi:hypothetical protein